MNKEYSEIGTLVLIILKNSISLYRFSTASNSCFANRGLVDSKQHQNRNPNVGSQMV